MHIVNFYKLIPEKDTKTKDISQKRIDSKYINLVIIIILLITISVIIFRNLYIIFDFPTFLEYYTSEDFYILSEAQQEGLFNYYNTASKSRMPLYLYYWYFIFFPFGIIPPYISIYFWEILRTGLSIFIVKNIYTISRDRNNFFVFLIPFIFGYIFDTILGNSNFLILFFLYLSYKYLDNSNFKNRIWIAGFFFGLACFKIYVIGMIPILLLTKKLDLKQLPKFISPFLLFLIPYILFPNYLFEFIGGAFGVASPDIVSKVFSCYLTFFQPAPFLIFSFGFLIILEYISKKKYRFMVYLTIILFFGLFIFNSMYIIAIGRIY
ncbi:MAG: hypothetical protein ACQERB_17480 [Promethearchaeati archaeon]